LKVGVAKVNITPPVGVPQAGYSSRTEASKGIHDELYAKAVAFGSDGSEVILVTTDTIGFRWEDTKWIRREIEEKVGIPGNNILINSSHTHSGPILGVTPYLKPELQNPDEAYLEVLKKKIVGLVKMAHDRMVESNLLFGMGSIPEGIGSNRRVRIKGRVVIRPIGNSDEPLGPVDPSVNVILSRVKERVHTVIFNYTCHATAAGAPLEISADYPGYAQRMIEKIMECTALFAQGCCGNINPNQYRLYPPPSWKDPERMGYILAAEVLKASRLASPIEGEPIKACRAEINLPVREEALPKEPLEENFRKLRIIKERDIEDGTVKTEVQAFKIGEVYIAGIPGEPFVEIGLEIKRRLTEIAPEAKGVITLGYCNDCGLGYVPIARAYDEGGYEPSATILAKGSAEIITEETLKLLRSIT